MLEGHLDEPDSAGDHRSTRREVGFCLLTAKHDLGDLWSVGEVGEGRLEHLDSRGLGPGGSVPQAAVCGSDAERNLPVAL